MTTTTSELTTIRELIEENARAIARRDLEAHMQAYAPDLLMFDAIPPFAYRGLEKLRQGWQMCLDHTTGDLDYRHHELEVTVSGDMALVTSLVSFSARPIGSDQELRSAMRNTMVLRRLDGAWKIVHAHGSAPFDPMSEKALIREPLEIA